MDILVDCQCMPPRAVVRVRGDLDLCSGDEVAAAVDQVLEQGCSDVLVDLRGVQFIDCAGLGFPVGSAHRVRARSGRLQLTEVSPVVARLLDLTGTQWLLDPPALVPAPRVELRGGGVMRLGGAVV